ncbi:MAG: hypothetical protein RLN88_03685 [Ekhidna sp.]|uniref:hypothetical protein n=1 Tax=Ekhidna sp. TaxID=2608089 RepID=UPI0032EC4DA6
MKQLLSIFILFLLVVSCDPCDDCETVSFEPTVSLIFINQDSIQHINDSLSVIAFNDSVINANIDSLDILRDSLEIVLDSIENGGSLNSQRMDLEQWIMDRQADSLLYAEKNLGTDTIVPILTQTRSTINSGLLRVDQIEILGTSYVNLFEDIDSATTWSIPLSYEGEFTQYEVTIAGVSEIIEFAYDNYQEVDQQRNVLIRARNIRVINEPYDSLINCEENCVDGEATFTFYF